MQTEFKCKLSFAWQALENNNGALIYRTCMAKQSWNASWAGSKSPSARKQCYLLYVK